MYRDGSKDSQVLSVGRNGETPAAYLRSRERPRVVEGVTERFRTGHGNMYVTVNFDERGKPFEIFVNLGKAGGCDSAQLEAVSRLASMALRSGIDPAEIIYNLNGITCCPSWDDGVQIRSAPDAIAKMLQRVTESGPGGAVPRETTGRLLCPDCNGRVAFFEGCETCTTPGCGWNRCN